MPRFAPLLLVALLALSGGTVWAQAEPSPITLEVAGPAGPKLRLVPRSFATVDVVLENTSDADVRGVLRVYRASKADDPTPALSLFYEVEVDLPRRGRRSETLPYYVQDREPQGQLCVSFEPEQGEGPPAVFPQTEIVSDLQVLVLSRPGLAEQLQKMLDTLLVPGRKSLLPTRALIADPQGLPLHSAGYSPYGAVVYAEGELPDGRAQPLLDWVAGGGDLWIVGSGGRSPLPAEFTDLLPAEVLGNAPRRLSALEAVQPLAEPLPRGDQTVIVDRLRARPGAYVVAGPRDEPLIVKGRYGAGWVTYFAFPLDSGPLKGWTGHRFLLRDQLRLPREDLERNGEPPPLPPLEEVQLNLTEALESLEPPSTWIVAPLLILYVALVSPLNYVLLRRVRKLSISQLSAGAIALVFAGAFYGIGMAYKGSEALVTQVGVVDLPAAPKGKARVDVMTGYFSIGRGQTQATGPKGALVGPLAALKLSNREARLRREGEHVELERVSLDTWALRRFRSLSVQDQGHLALDLSFTDDRITGSIANETAQELRSPVLLFREHSLELRDLKPGEQATVDLVPPVVARDRQPIPALVRNLIRSSRGRYRPYHGMETAGIVASGPVELDTPQRRLLATLQRRLDRVPTLPGHVPALLLAQASTAPAGLIVAEGGRTALETTLVVHEVQVAVPTKGRLRFNGLPPRLASFKSSGESTWLPTAGHTGTLPILQGSGDAKNPTIAYWRWQLPASEQRPLRVTSFRLDLQLDYDSTKLEPKEVVLEYFDFEQGAWRSVGPIDTLPRESGITYWPEARKAGEAAARAALHPTTGEVWVRLKNGSYNDLSFFKVRLDVGVEVVPTR